MFQGKYILCPGSFTRNQKKDVTRDNHVHYSLPVFQYVTVNKTIQNIYRKNKRSNIPTFYVNIETSKIK
jgi:hypothetical protein